MHGAHGTLYDIKNLSPGHTVLTGTITFGAGAVAAYDIKGVATVTRDAQGRYTLALRKPWYGGCIGLFGTMLTAAGFTALIIPQLYGTPTASPANPTTPTLQFGFSDGTALVDPTNGDVFYITLLMSGTTFQQ